MKADLRISIKDYRRNKSVKVLLYRAPWPRQFFVRINGERWPKGTETASLSRLFAALRKDVVLVEAETEAEAQKGGPG
jgi:hypothetical protein